MENTKRSYETTFIVNASLEDSQIETAVTHATETITRNGGEITAINRWGRKRLAYPIQKKNNGFYVNLEYIALGSAVQQLERTFLLDENVLRFLTIQLDKKALSARQQVVPAAAPQAAPEPAPVPAKEPLFDDEANASPSREMK